MCGKCGFTLVEILFVVIIAAGVVAFSVPAYKRAVERSTYSKATGTLLDIGNAIQALKRDLVLQNSMSGSGFPLEGQYQITNFALLPNPGAKTIPEQLADTGSMADFDSKFAKALFQYLYLEPFSTAHGYTVYAINGNSSTVCSSRCRKPSTSSSEIVACLCKEGTTNVCYFVAVFLEDGTVIRITKKNTDCNM